MAYQNSPRIITDSLVLCLDAGNRKSYPGSGTSWLDLTRNNNGTLTNSPTFSSANMGGIVFNGTNTYVSFGSITLSSTRTFIVWFKVNTSDATYRRIVTFSADDTGTDTAGYTLGVNNFALNGGFGGSPYNGYVSMGTATSNTWVCIAQTISGNVTLAYKNGVYVGTATNSGTVSLTTLGYLGRYNAFYNQNLDALISEL